MGRGRSGLSSKAGGGGGTVQDFPEAFAPGKDFQAVGGVDHAARTVSRTTQGEWDKYSAAMNSGVSKSDENKMMRQFSATPNSKGAYVSGYVRTQNSFAINEAFYDPKNAGKSINQIFSRKADRDTVKALDKAINNHTTPADASYTRFSSPNGIQGALGLNASQMQMLSQAPNMNASQLATLNRALRGTRSSSASYTSTSANRSLNAFSNPNAKQSKGFIYERKISVPKGTKAYAPKGNAQESEVIFGRGMKTRVTGISIAKDGHIVIHESFDGYN